VKILLSAFACEPGRGSEFEVGWSWTIGLAELGHEIMVLTRSASQPAIERALATLPAGLKRPHFVYFDLPAALCWETRGPLHLHHIIWQHRAARVAEKLNASEHFDCVHHVTYAGLRSPSFMGRLGIPFIFGPVGGGEVAPWRLRIGYTARGMIIDAARDLANLAVRFEPAIAQTFARATKIYVTTGETLKLLPRRYRGKAAIELAIGSDGRKVRPAATINKRSPDGTFRVLYAGRFVDYKGMHLGLRAFAKLLETKPKAALTMVGKGPVEYHWRRLAEWLGVASQITWLPWQRQEDMTRFYAEHDVLLFPALHDSGGLIALEAMNHGLPVVCLQLGGPGILVDDTCGRAIPVAGKTRAQVISALADVLNEFADLSVRSTLSGGAYTRCNQFTWQKKVQRIYGLAS
jgi:glycosyltransferase involved in cell wall biosynthesis